VRWLSDWWFNRHSLPVWWLVRLRLELLLSKVYDFVISSHYWLLVVFVGHSYFVIVLWIFDFGGLSQGIIYVHSIYIYLSHTHTHTQKDTDTHMLDLWINPRIVSKIRIWRQVDNYYVRYLWYQIIALPSFVRTFLAKDEWLDTKAFDDTFFTVLFGCFVSRNQ